MLDRLDSLIDNRQEIVNPYDEIQDLSGMLSNPMANLGVATQAAEMQIEQTDIALANTLDTIRATGGGAGGKYASAPHNTGGSGVIILSMADADYSGTTTGSPTVTTSGSDTIITFTGDGSYTA